MTDIILFAVLAFVITCAAVYIYKAKKSGQTCIGCPHAKECTKSKCGCGCADEDTAND